MQPKTFVELCTQLKAGQIVQWHFRSAAVTDFNVHYHVGDEVKYHERRESVADASGRLMVELDQGYCWMWTNRSSAQTVVTVILERAIE